MLLEQITLFLKIRTGLLLLEIPLKECKGIKMSIPKLLRKLVYI
jgi:hypothetical protein